MQCKWCCISETECSILFASVCSMEDFGGFRWNFAAGPFPMVTIEDKHRGWLGNTGHWKMIWPFLGPNLNLPQLLCLPVVRFGECFFKSNLTIYTHYILPWFFFLTQKKTLPNFCFPNRKKNNGKWLNNPKFHQAFGRLRRWCRRLNLHHFPRCFGHRGRGALVALVGGKCGSLGKAKFRAGWGWMWGLWNPPPKKKDDYGRFQPFEDSY